MTFQEGVRRKHNENLPVGKHKVERSDQPIILKSIYITKLVLKQSCESMWKSRHIQKMKSSSYLYKNNWAGD